MHWPASSANCRTLCTATTTTTKRSYFWHIAYTPRAAVLYFYLPLIAPIIYASRPLLPAVIDVDRALLNSSNCYVIYLQCEIQREEGEEEGTGTLRALLQQWQGEQQTLDDGQITLASAITIAACHTKGDKAQRETAGHKEEGTKQKTERKVGKRTKFSIKRTKEVHEIELSARSRQRQWKWATLLSGWAQGIPVCLSAFFFLAAIVRQVNNQISCLSRLRHSPGAVHHG